MPHFATGLTLILAITNQWALFASSDSPDSINAIKSAFMERAMSSLLCFHTFILSGACHLAFHQSPQADQKASTLLRLSSKARAIQELNKEIQRSDGYIS